MRSIRYIRKDFVESVVSGVRWRGNIGRYPKYKERYIKLCNEIMTIRKQEGLTNKYNFRTGEDYFNFWLNNKLPEQEYDLFKI